jgi:shikimate kinase
VFLVGFMGAGKTSVGRILGRQLNWTFEDLDDRVEQRERRTVPEIFRESGEKEFRRAEHDALRTVLQEIACGAVKVVADLLGTFGVPTVFLDAPVAELWRRCSKQADQSGAQRPLLQSMEQFSRLYEIRRKIYSRASLSVQTEDRNLEEIASEIARVLALKKVDVRVEQGEVE